MKALVLDFEELKHGGDTLRASDGVTEHDAGLSLLLTQVVKHVQVFVFLGAADGSLDERVGHALFLGQVNNFGLGGPEPYDARKSSHCFVELVPFL